MKKDKTLTELIVGIIFLGAVVQIIILIAFQNDLYNAAGLWSGIVIGIGMAVHMKHSIEDALDLGEEGAPKHIRKTYAFRMTVVIIAMGCVLYFLLLSPIVLRILKAAIGFLIRIVRILFHPLYLLCAFVWRKLRRVCFRLKVFFRKRRNSLENTK